MPANPSTHDPFTILASRRLVSLSPNVSMILFALGADACVIGRTHYCLRSIQNYLSVWRIPERTVAQRLQYWDMLPAVGAWPQADGARVKALQPEMILASGSGTLGTYAAQTFGVQVDRLINFDTRIFADLDQHMTQIGRLVGKTQEAARLTEQLATWREDIIAKRIVLPRRPTVLFEYCVCIKYDPDPERRFANPGRYIMAGGHLAPEMIRLSGGEPLFTQPGDTVQWVAFDAIREAQPDVVLLFDCNGCPNAGKHPIHTRKGWSELTAVSRQAVYPLHHNISNPNLCFPVALEQLVGILHDAAAHKVKI